MALITTAGSSTADAFVSVADCTTFCESHGLTDWTDAARSPAEDDEAAIRRATAWLSTAFSWKGWKSDGRNQALAWPRAGVCDGEGWAILADEIPTEIVQACCVAAAYERANPGGLTPAVTMTDRVKSEQVGPLRVEYASTAMTPDAARPILSRVSDMVSGLVAASGGSYAGKAVRS